MKPIASTESYAVFDDVLSPEDFTLFWNYMQDEDYAYVRSGKWIKAFRTGDGDCLQGPVYLSERVTEDQPYKPYPTGLGIDLLFKKVRAEAEAFKPWIGTQGKDWDYFSARPYLYPAGTGLSWHDDSLSYIGAFAYYGHPEWNIQWGGELLIAAEKPRIGAYPKRPVVGAPEGKMIGFHLDNAGQNERLLGPGLGTYVQPKPNRLVLIGRGISHTIKKTEADAGDRARASVTGFFVKRQKQGKDALPKGYD
ncbi:MAG: 2OG-Fe(II) oxygenase [Elusimicrobia bacterium]|nr:2OG-Fe(II) oxygenase [Elusimicrobiota bacterium]